ncbi:hypothetical protein [Glaciimonas sp. PAMC28666]|uniref:hypothetical protein n=1 Tax=Glaciimonas sp. PAMC28666 TaxID=2807626 RepID=UPI0019626B8A|nr:hypothetical protein [Glaciimonas sp. PAMC28666]QRX82263.1 hypothetical protein JQN73_19565 [Glaciimonas sp. PAMC28666]
MAPHNLYIAQTDEMISVSEAPISESAKNYFATLKAVALLKHVSDFEDMSTGSLKLVFLQREKFEIPIYFDALNLNCLTEVDGWLSMLSDDAHKEQRKVIFRTVVLDALKQIDIRLRFIKFLELFSELYQRFQDNYQLYVSEFSFEKILGDVTEKKLDYILKFNKAFSDIQNQLLAIPVAVVLVGGQLEHHDHLMVKNVVIFLGIFVFSLLMSMLIRNQVDVLNSIAHEISLQREELAQNHSAIAAKFAETYKELKIREDRQRTLIRIVDGLVALALGGTTWLFLWYSGTLSLLGIV